MTYVSVLLCPHVCPTYQEQVSELSAEKEALNEKLKAEEERRKRILSDKNLVQIVTPIIIAFCHCDSQLRQNKDFGDCVNAGRVDKRLLTKWNRCNVVVRGTFKDRQLDKETGRCPVKFHPSAKFPQQDTDSHYRDGWVVSSNLLSTHKLNFTTDFSSQTVKHASCLHYVLISSKVQPAVCELKSSRQHGGAQCWPESVFLLNMTSLCWFGRVTHSDFLLSPMNWHLSDH